MGRRGRCDSVKSPGTHLVKNQLLTSPLTSIYVGSRTHPHSNTQYKQIKSEKSVCLKSQHLGRMGQTGLPWSSRPGLQHQELFFSTKQTQTKLKQKFRTQSGEVTLKEQWQEKTLSSGSPPLQSVRRPQDQVSPSCSRPVSIWPETRTGRLAHLGPLGRVPGAHSVSESGLTPKGPRDQ